MAKNKSIASGSTPSLSVPSVLSGTRTRVYQHDEHLTMINRDKFDTLESVIQDRGIFSHLATGLLAAAVPLGLEMIIQFISTRDVVSGSISAICIVVVLFGVFFAFLASSKSRKYREARAGLFANENILSDETLINLSDGTTNRKTHTTV